MLKRTPLHAAHLKLGAKLIDFGGWEMPVYYSSIIEEHLAVRSAAGIFDISHMGEVAVQGPDTAEFLNWVLTNDVRRAPVGRGQYTLMCNERGGVVDDLYAYHLAENEFLLVINASRINEDVAWLESRLRMFGNQAGVRVRNLSDDWAAVAIQGPAVGGFVDRLLQRLGGVAEAGRVASSLTKNQIAKVLTRDGVIYAARTGYTGEDGFELMTSGQGIEKVWSAALEEGATAGLVPCGLGARDTLRTEMCYPLYGHELNEEVTPIEAGLGAFVSLDKGDFIGRPQLVIQKQDGVSRKLAAFRMADKSAPPRPGYLIWSRGTGVQPIGQVASGTQSPSLGVGIGMAFLELAFAVPETPIDVEIRGRRFPAKVVSKPIYRKAI